VQFPGLRFRWPVHPNPHVQVAAQDLIHIQHEPPMGLTAFRQALDQALLVLTDSGGVQEEAAHLGVPCLVARNHTDRPESVASHQARVVGTDPTFVAEEVLRELLTPVLSAKPSWLFGDGQAGARIARLLTQVPATVP